MSHKCLSKLGYIVHKDKLNSEQIVRIRQELRILPVESGFTKPVAYNIFSEDEHRFFVPRYWGEAVFGRPDFLALPVGDKITVTMKDFTLRENQKTVWSNLEKHFVIGVPEGGGGLVSLPCGHGKTILAIATAIRLQVKTLIVVHTETLFDQWIEELSKLTNGRIGTYKGTDIRLDDVDFVVAMLQTIVSRDVDVKFNSFGMVIVDEAHHIAAKTFSQALPKIFTRYTLALSATPNRKDGTQRVFLNYLGPVIHAEKRSGTDRLRVCVVKMKSTDRCYAEHKIKNVQTGRDMLDTARMSRCINVYIRRNMLVVHLAVHLSNLHTERQVFILCSSRAQIEWIRDKLLEIVGSAGGREIIGVIWGKGRDIGKKDHKASIEAAKKCRIILATFHVASEGLNIPTLNTLILASPAGASQDDLDQKVGRILRKVHENCHPKVYDLVDKCGNYEKHFKSRLVYYRDMDYDVSEDFEVNLESWSETEPVAMAKSGET